MSRMSLLWPVAALIATGLLHLGAEVVRPELQSDFTPSTIGPLLLAYGLWIGWSVADRGGSFAAAAAAGAAVGLLPLGLDVVGFGVLLGRGVDVGITTGMFGFLIILFGALAGAAFVASRPSAVAR